MGREHSFLTFHCCRDAAIDGLEGQNVSELHQQEKAVLLKVCYALD